MSIRRRSIAALGAIAVAAALALLTGAFQHAARADTPGTPVNVNTFRCIGFGGGQTTVPTGSTIVIQQAFASQTRGGMLNFLGAQTTAVGISDGPMFDVSGAYSAINDGVSWVTIVRVNSGVTLANPGDQMRYTFVLTSAKPVPDVFNPAAGGQPGKPFIDGPGLIFGGTCTVTAT